MDRPSRGDGDIAVTRTFTRTLANCLRYVCCSASLSLWLLNVSISYKQGSRAGHWSVSAEVLCCAEHAINIYKLTSVDSRNWYQIKGSSAFIILSAFSRLGFIITKSIFDRNLRVPGIGMLAVA